MGMRQNKPRPEQEGEATAGGAERGAQKEKMDSVSQGCGHLGATVPCFSLIPHHLGGDLKDRGSL